MTASNLLEPKDLRLINGCYVDLATAAHKPVVWLTDILDFGDHVADGLGLCGGFLDKMQVALCIDINPLLSVIHVEKWSSWAERNGIDPKWYRALKKATPLWDNYYISERPMPFDMCVPILRPDIQKIYKGGA